VLLDQLIAEASRGKSAFHRFYHPKWGSGEKITIGLPSGKLT
jgi:hypothetical protein